MNKEVAIVYRGGGRRWFTKHAACRADARAKIRTRCECEKGDWFIPPYTCVYHSDMNRFRKIVRRLARLYEKGTTE